jgi:hypothetical protein
MFLIFVYINTELQFMKISRKIKTVTGIIIITVFNFPGERPSINIVACRPVAK